MKQNFNSFLNIFVTNRGNKSVRSNKQWLRSSELRRWLLLLIWSTRSDDIKSDLFLLESRIIKIWDKSGSQFLYPYLKEVMRITTRRMAKLTVIPSSKTFVKIDELGFPTIIPKRLVSILNDRSNRSYIIGILTFLSIYRILNVKVKPSLDSIISPFTGKYRTLDRDILSHCITGLGWRVDVERIRSFNNFKLISMMSAGPNSLKAIMGSGLDALALAHQPHILISLIRYMINYSLMGIFYSIWLLILILLLSPYYLISRLVGAKKPIIGKLSVVYDQAGKARIVAITNYWVQLALKPLHDCLSSLLRGNKNDGTFNQEKPFNDLLERVNKDQILYGFDLSSATDRLPIDIQRDILTQLGFNGKLWMQTLGFNWIPSFGDKTPVKYSVGQPMGAYSSFNMLAITHHVIVQAAAVKSNHVLPFKDYCILGDDIVIANDKIALNYQEIISDLGVEMSLQKSIISKDFTEFAKKLRGKKYDFTPIGPGLLLFTIRNKWYISTLIVDIVEKGLIDINKVLSHFCTLPKKYLKYGILVKWSLQTFVLRNVIMVDPLRDITHNILPRSLTGSRFYKALLEWNRIKLVNDWIKFKKDFKVLFRNTLFISQSRIGMPDIVEMLFLPIMPSTLFLVKSMLLNLDDLIKRYFNLSISPKETFGARNDILNMFLISRSVPMLNFELNDRNTLKENLDNLYYLSIHAEGISESKWVQKNYFMYMSSMKLVHQPLEYQLELLIPMIRFNKSI